MKSAAIVSAVLLLAGVAADTTSTTFPGRCETTKDCKSYGSNYACVSVDTSVAGLEQLSMCIPGDQVCSGRIAGLCPTFTSWPSNYRIIQPIWHSWSAGSTVDDDGDITVSDANGTGTVQCYQRNFTVNDEYVVVNGIYQCLDEAKYVDNNGGYIKNITNTVVKQCGWNATSQTLCSGHGTCSPLVDFAQDYECKCNAGYNAPTIATLSVSQCGTEGTCDFGKGTTTGECACDKGAKGNQCMQCDASASSDVVCNGHGTCGTNGVCTCSSGYNGTFCGDSTGTEGTSPSPSAATSVKMAISTIVAALLMAAFA
ncbi:EGF-like domain, extracellular [Phytophthora cactorum]|nr:EGF-like domain, extracellular [Phytophthora cactorum]